MYGALDSLTGRKWNRLTGFVMVNSAIDDIGNEIRGSGVIDGKSTLTPNRGDSKVVSSTRNRRRSAYADEGVFSRPVAEVYIYVKRPNEAI